MHRDLVPKPRVDVLQTQQPRLGEEEINHRHVNRGRTYQDQEEFPPDVVQRDGTGDEDDDLGCELVEHADRRALAAYLGGEDFGHVQVLRGIEAGAPEQDEEIDEEDGGALAGFVGAAGVDGLQRAFTDQRNEDTAGADEHEGPTTDFVDEEGGEDVAGEGGGRPEGEEEDGEVAGETELGEEDDGVVGDY